MIRVLLAENHTLVRKGLRLLLDGEENLKIVGEADDGREAVKQVTELLPDVVVMDISMPNLNGLQATEQIKRRIPDVKVLILSRHTQEEYIFQSLRAGADGYLIKKSAPSELIAAIQSIHNGESYLSPTVSKVIVDEYHKQAGSMATDDKYSSLTEREKEILQLIAEGHSTEEIAQQLFISVNTVATHRAHTMEKLGLHTIAELTQFAIRRGIIDPES